MKIVIGVYEGSQFICGQTFELHPEPQPKLASEILEEIMPSLEYWLGEGWKESRNYHKGKRDFVTSTEKLIAGQNG